MRAPDEICWDCPVCGGPQRLDEPVCDDGHGVDCPDRLCACCASAFVLDPVLTTDRPARAARAA